MIRPIDDKVRLLPFVKALRGYTRVFLRRDLQSGATVAVFAVPQVMAYALLAGIEPVHGLYAAIVMAIVASLWGSSPYLNTGPTNSAALLTVASLAPLAALASPEYMGLVFWFTLLVGVMRLVMGLLRLGKLVHYVSEAAFLGFTVGAGLLIACGQLHELLGVEASTQQWFVGKMIEVFAQIGAADVRTVLIGLGVLGLMLALDRYSRRLPVALVAIGLATVAAMLLGSEAGIRVVGDIGDGVSGRPPSSLAMVKCDLPTLLALVPGAFAVSLIGLTEAVSIAQSLALKRGQVLNFNQEFVGQGLSHVVGAFLHGMPGSGSFSRSALIEQAGGKTLMANVYFGLCVGLGLAFLARWLNCIPVASLAGLLLYIGYKLVDAERIRRVFLCSRRDTIVMLLTFGVTVAVKIEYGIFAGVIASLLFYAKRIQKLAVVEVRPAADGALAEHPYAPASEHEASAFVVMKLNSNMFFAVAQEIREQLNEIKRLQKAHHILLCLNGQSRLCYPCWNALYEFARSFNEDGGKLLVCGVGEDFVRVLKRAGLDSALPEEQVCADDGQDLDGAIDWALCQVESPAGLSASWAARRKEAASED